MSHDSALFGQDEFVITRRPCLEGNNVGTWIGFKHVTYLVQEAVRDWLRAHQLAPGMLFEIHGLATEVVECRLRLSQALRVDDVATLVVKPRIRPGDSRASFDVSLFRDDRVPTNRLAQGQLSLVWRPTGGDLEPTEPAPANLRQFISADPAPRRRDPIGTPVADVLKQLRPRDKASVGRCYRVVYPLCCYTERIQFSAYVRLLEELVDALLEERGIAIGTLLRERRWIPVVSRVEFNIREPVFLDEMLYCVFSIEDILKDLIFTGSLACYIVMDGRPICVATGAIDHAYLQFQTRMVEATVVPLDARVVQALRGTPEDR